MNRLLVSYRNVWIGFLIQACGGAMAPSDPNDSAGSTKASGPVGGSHSATNIGGSLNGPAGGYGVVTSGGVQTGPYGGASTGGTTSTGYGTTGPTGFGGTGSTGFGGTGYTGRGGTGPTGYGGTGSTGYGGTGYTGRGGTGSTGYGGTGSTGYGGTGSTGYGGTGSTGYGGTGSTGYGGATGPATVVTSGEGDYWKSGTATWGQTGSDAVNVTTGATGTAWDGFGGTFNEMGWNYLSMLGVAERDRAMRLLFASDGARFVFGRIPIGANDYAMDRYSLDEIPSDSPYDYAMEKFSLDRDKLHLMPYVKAALALNPKLRLWASPWTPPTWMKDNGSFDSGNMKDDMQTLAAYALYLARFVEDYRKEGIGIEAVHVQNEPGYAQAYPSCLWSATLTARFISRYLGPTFGERNLSTQIFLGTLSNADNDPTIINSVTVDATAMSYVKGFGVQWNMLNSVAGLKQYGRSIVQTSHRGGNYPWTTAFDVSKAPNDHAYAVESWGQIRDWIKAGATSYMAWNMVLDTVGKSLDTTRPWPQNALLTVDVATKTLNVTPAYYVFRHISQFVEPGAKVIPATGGDALAFRNPDGSYVAVLYNSGATKVAAIRVFDKDVKFNLPGNGWATVYWKK